ncbi:6-bladed beta-propeller [Runella sp.]|uniref:6-bladed beta-propeller n=1 Tax=Runella sp. TaxID=1960881 RepID=UPI002620AB8A|nr:6-bladed beta-propeller [Runella sp.]
MKSRRAFLRAGSLAVTAAFLPKAGAASRRGNEVIIGHGSHRYKVVPGWGILDAGKNPVNNCHELIEDSKGRILLLTDEVKNNVLVYDKSGKLVETWGNSYPGAHGFTIAGEGSDQFLLITDHKRNQVIKTDLKGREILKLDYPRETGLYEAPYQYRPTETAVNPANGDMYVVDGYGLNYVLHYDRHGKLIRHFGGGGESLTEKFDCCHGITVDTRDSRNYRLFITDRKRNCLKYFTLDGKYLSAVPLPGSFVCRPRIHKDYIFAAVFRSTSQEYANSGYFQILDKENKVISTPGGSAPTYINGVLQPQQKEDPFKVFMHPHDVYIDSDENVYVAQWLSEKTYPIKLERV